jgi:PAS domain S-box-containing protein
MDVTVEQVLRRELAEARAREQELRDFLESAALGVHTVGPDGVILWANQAELDLLGYTAEEYVGHEISEFHVDHAVILDILDRLRSRETLRNYEARLRCKDGTVRHVLISSNVRWKHGDFIHTRCFTRDITERKGYEQRLLLQYKIVRLLMDSSTLSDAAPAVLRLIGEQLGCRAGLMWTPEEHTLACTASWEPGDMTEPGVAAVSRHFRFSPNLGLPGRVWSEKTPVWVSDLRHDDNFPRLRLISEFGLRSAFAFPITVEDNVLGVMEFFAEEVRPADREVLEMARTLGHQLGEFVERTVARRRLADSEESYRVLTETATDGVITVDESSTILLVNTAAARLFGYARAELMGSDLTRLIPEGVREQYRAALAEYVETGVRHTWKAVPLTGQHRDGHEIPLEVSFGEYLEGTRRIFVGILRDITERKRLDDKLRQSAKLESLGVLAGGIAHDFNNLLTGILGNISLAMESTARESEAMPLMENAVEASERAAHLTKQLLAYAGKGRFLIEPTDISALVRDISALVRSSIPKNVEVRLELGEGLPPVEADVAQMQQLVMNLVINAAEAIPEGRQGIVLVTTSAQDAGAEILQHTFGSDELTPGPYVAINVHDNGIGMDEATVQRIFDPFFTTKFTGRGLGLAAALGIVRGHRGGLKVFSAPGQGTTFKVFLPGSFTAAQAENVAPEAAVGGSGTVLVVDDEPIVRKIAAASLERYGYEVFTAANGQEGVARFAELHGVLSIVVLDMTMPVMDGEEAFRRMRKIDSNVPVVLSSGFNELDAIRRFTGKGLSGFIQKPYTAAALAEKIRAVLQGSKLQNC